MVTKHMLAKAVAMLNQATVVTDAKMNIVYMNALAEAILGAAVEEMGDRKFPLNLTITGCPYPDTFDGRLEGTDGISRAIRFSVTPMAMGSRITGYIFRMVSQNCESFHPAILN